MKFYVIHNALTDSYGCPFMAESDDKAILSVCENVKAETIATTVAQCTLYCIGSFNRDNATIKTKHKSVVATASHLVSFCSRFVDNAVQCCDEAIKQLNLFKDYLLTREATEGGVLNDQSEPI